MKGEGSSGRVLAATVSNNQDDTAPTQQVAVKIYGEGGRPAAREVSVLRDLKGHPDLFVQILAKGVVQFEEGFKKAAVLQLCQGSLEDDMEKQGRGYETPHEAVEAVAKLHELGITHRDLKPGNLFINTEGKVKIGDFTSASRRKTMKLPMGTCYYTAPKAFPAHVLLRQLAAEDNPQADMGAAAAATAGPAAAAADFAAFDNKVDIWSVGTMVLHLYAGSFEKMVDAVVAGEDHGRLQHEEAWLLQVQKLASDCPAMHWQCTASALAGTGGADGCSRFHPLLLPHGPCTAMGGKAAVGARMAAACGRTAGSRVLKVKSAMSAAV